MSLPRHLLAVFALVMQTTVFTSSERLPKVFITISAEASVKQPNIITERQIQLNWYDAHPSASDWIGLFDHDVQTGDISNPLVQHQINGQEDEGTYTTNVSMPFKHFDGELERQCLGFWVAYVRNDASIASNCIKTEPNWMYENQQVIGDFRFADLFIPGSHDAGSYRAYRGWPDENPITKYKITQDEDIWNQLVYGIRHLDLRIGYYARTNEFFINHGTFRVNPLLPELKSIRKFLDRTKEFVVLDFHSFESGFEAEQRDLQARHEKLLWLLKSILGDLIIPDTWGNQVTLNTLWAANQRALITYNDDFQTESDILWPGLYQAWANVISLQELKDYFTDLFSTPTLSDSGDIWSAQAELTTGPIYFVVHPYSGVRTLADMANINVTYWFQDLWWSQANCVATDFFLGNNIIEVAIKSNRKKRDLMMNEKN